MFKFDTAEFTTKRTGGPKGTPYHKLVKPKIDLKKFEEFTSDELIALPKGHPMMFDVESYGNYWCVGFLDPVAHKVVHFEISPDGRFNTAVLLWMMEKFCCIGFNSRKYDIPIIFAALQGFDAELLFLVTQKLMEKGENNKPLYKAKDVAKMFGFQIEWDRFDHIDLIEVAPLQGGLKLYGARLQADRLQDLPYPVGANLSREEALEVKHYNVNDLHLTRILWEELAGEIKLREELGEQYKLDLRSKSDAQIAEAVVCQELKRITGKYPKDNTDDIYSVKYEAPKWVGFVSKELRDVVDSIEAAEFLLDANGSPVWPKGLGELVKDKNGKEVWQLSVKIGDSTYKLGMGGLHSSESCVKHVASEGLFLIDRDVASFYPRIILNEKLFPKHLGKAFLEVYDYLVTKRLQAKAVGNKKIANSLKIVINGLFGKLGNRHSKVYSPELLLKVTITGQLALLMLIEMIEHYGIPVVSGNTDGIIIKCPAERYDELNGIVALWERITNFETEETQYHSTYSRDVNNYLAFKLKFDKEAKRFIPGEIDFDPKGKTFADRMGCKVKGVYSEVGSALNSVLSKNAENLICTDAVIKMIVDGVPLHETIQACNDVRRFTTIRQVDGGAQKNGVFVGKVVRWYYATDCLGPIEYIGNGSKVGKSDGAKPLQDLPPSLPQDIDYDKYVQLGQKILSDIGFTPKPQAMLFA